MVQVLTSLIRQLQQRYSLEESRAMARRLLQEPPLELSVMQAFTAGVEDLPRQKQQLLAVFTERLLQGEPLQYVMGHEYFCGRCLEVGNGVLIPRPETQDLVAWIEADHPADLPLRMADACTGSGCIAAALATHFPLAQLWALDLSAEALDYARRNTWFARERVHVIQQDILQPWPDIPVLDILVSNPPYIPDEERENMRENVKKWEPEMALFVRDDSPLGFYQALGLQGQQLLRPGGTLYVEINQRFGKETQMLFRRQGYTQVELRNDRFGVPRMVKAIKYVGREEIVDRKRAL